MKKILFFVLIFTSFFACQEEGTDTGYARINGETMGTTYTITYQNAAKTDLRQPIDSLLKAINQEVSTYIPSSTISRFNQGESLEFEVKKEEKHFLINLLESQKNYALTTGSFDPTVMPLVNYWGFGYTPKKPVEQVDSLKIDTLRQLVGFDKIQWDTLAGSGNILLKRHKAGVQLDFSAIAKGYAVDKVGEFLAERGIENFFVEIGGETVCKGKNPVGEAWRVGISKPQPDAQMTDFQQIIEISEGGLATSGNYRNFFEVDGQKYAHTINPKTGFPQKSNLLSVTVVANDCTTADALATGFMVMGLEAAQELAERLPDVEAFFVFSDESGAFQTRFTSNFERFLPKKNKK